MPPAQSQKGPSNSAGTAAGGSSWLRGRVTSLRGVGATRAEQLARLGIVSVQDLLLHGPRRYEDRRHFKKIAELDAETPATVRGAIVAQGLKRFRGGMKSVFEMIVDDGSARLHCRWWNLPFMESYFHVGDEVFVFGKLTDAKPRTMDHPETEVVEGGAEDFIHVARIAPVYPLTEGLPQRWLRGTIWRALETFKGRGGVLQVIKGAAMPMAAAEVEPPIFNALRMVHFPESPSDAEAGRQRLALEEFLALQLQLQWRRKRFEASAKGLPCGGNNRLMKPFLARLGFKLTGAQTGVLREIRADMGGGRPMRRLLQGDVGSGKTAVAACSALMALESGLNAALMAPTEILAGQHFENFKRWFEPLGVTVRLQTGHRKTMEKPAAAGRPAPVLFVGTHALLSENSDLPRLGLVVIDEQHRFGVAQRERLVRKGNYPHLLVMTATPIPRTLGLTLYGDLDVSVLGEMPPRRGRVKTFVRATAQLPKVLEFIREKIAAGRQAYIVYPRIEGDWESPNGGGRGGGLKAVLTEAERLRKVLAPYRVGLMHGRLKGAEKEGIMADFRANNIQVLVATTLIEVGVDAPNATVLLVENAEQFGLAQLHQLRGRIGRGDDESFCILISEA
ncbi:MAG: ATP-dependent DNA helicase RecG, partial [Verrucomicrobia bacterium]|nr:ATP-dependent DNA helicase RecG [Verrucomicrobiota bacterium]